VGRCSVSSAGVRQDSRRSRSSRLAALVMIVMAAVTLGEAFR
jgi:hypothetical protein